MSNQKPEMSSKYTIYSAFIIGLSASIAFRIIIVINHIDPSWVRPLWYFAVLGNFLFFFYRFRITEKRKKAVENYQLIDKIKALDCMEENDRDVLIYLLSSIKKSPENINYLIIFVFSIIAIALDIGLSFFE